MSFFEQISFSSEKKKKIEHQNSKKERMKTSLSKIAESSGLLF
jgi:hypothetical protein